MRKTSWTIFFTLSMFVAFSARAQIDTIQGKVPYLHYNFYDSTWCQSQVNQGFLYYMHPAYSIINRIGTTRINESGYYYGGYGCLICEYYDEMQEVAIRMNMDSVSKISGLAWGYYTSCQWDSPIENQYLYARINTPYYFTSDYIFNIYDNLMNLIWSDTVATGDLSIDCYMKAGFDVVNGHDEAYRQFYSTGHGGYEYPAYIGLYKVHFDTTVLVPETFYIGITSSTPISTIHDTSLIITAFYEHYSTDGHGDSIYCFPYEERRYRVSHGSEEAINDWEDEECHYGVQTCLYPILDLPCDDITGLRCESVGSAGTMAFVQWDANPRHAAYEVSYGPKGTPAGAGTVVTTTVPRFMHTLDRNTRYDFYVRARCDYDTTKWSAWSDTLHVHMATLGIQDADAVEWSLMPNPAHGSVTVQCGEGIKRVELFTVKGERIETHSSGLGRSSQDFCSPSNLEGELRSCSLDLTGLSKGIYIVQITTARGTAARKLAVE